MMSNLIRIGDASRPGIEPIATLEEKDLAQLPGASAKGGKVLHFLC